MGFFFQNFSSLLSLRAQIFLELPVWFSFSSRPRRCLSSPSTPELIMSKLILTAKRLRNLDGNQIKRYKSWVILALYLSLQNKPSTGILHLRVSLPRARSLLLIHLKAPLLHVSRFCGLIGMLLLQKTCLML